MLEATTVKRAIGSLSLLRFFPADPDTRAALGEMLLAMCPDDDSCDWLVRRTLELHNEWPGPVELRAILCAKYKPTDGVECHSAIYSGGIPRERGVETGACLSLPPGEASEAGGTAVGSQRAHGD